MSGGRSYAPKEPLSNEQRFEDLERKYEVIQGRIQAYDKVLEEYELLQKKYNNFQFIFQEFSTKSLSVENEFRSQIASLTQAKNDAQRGISSLSESSKEIAHEVQEILVFMEEKSCNLLKEICLLSEQMKKLVSDKVTHAELEALKGIHKELISKQEKNNASSKESMLVLQASLDSIVQNFSTKLELLNEHGKAIQSLIIWVNGFEDKIEKQMKQNFSESASKAASDHSAILSKLSAMKEEILGTPTSNAAVECRILNKLEMTAIESANAMRMMQTNQDRIKLAEKKIESLTTQLTKYEIK